MRYKLDGDIDAETAIKAGSCCQVDVTPYIMCLRWIVYYDEISGDPKLSLRFVSGRRLENLCPSFIISGGVGLQEKYPSRLYGKYAI